MNRNLKLLFTLFVALVAALTGCGGGDDPDYIAPQIDSGDSGTDANEQDSRPDSDTDAGDSAPDQVQPDTGNDSEVDSGEDVTPDSGEDSDSGEDAEPDSAEPDADADTPDAPPAEICDGIDNNANGSADEGFECKLGTSLQCQTTCGSIGTTVCQAGSCTWSDCTPPAEVCGNGIDDNCNGKTDCADSACMGITACQVESCDGIDNNGNGIADEGFECKLGTTGLCQTACGSTGMITCVAGCTWSACQKPAENCNNGGDEDCDGKVDCHDPDCASAPHCQCTPPNIGADCMIAGEFSECDPSKRCNCSFLWDYTATGNFTCVNQEVCNGFDDNANGQVDETFTCVKNSTQSCITTCNSTGQKTCGSTCEWGSCQPPVENCTNGKDDDCDGKADCADPDCVGLLQCQTEVCDGADNNGNNLVDETFQCIKGSAPVTCLTSCNSTGTKPCLANCSYGSCQPPVENCTNGADDDCDGKTDCADSDCTGLLQCQAEVCDGADNNGNNLVDETFACVKGSAPVSCITSCNSTGTKPCLANCSYGSCQPPVENCTNGADDDCDGKTDCADSDCSGTPACVSPENCTNGVDDDGDNLTDCADPDCSADVACHDFGTCPAQSPTGVPYTCGTWQQDTVPNSIFLIKSGCANSEFNQWAIGGTYTDVKAIRLTGNHTWTDVPLPVEGKTYIASQEVICLGQSNVFLLYNNDDGGVILHWNGSSLIRLIPNQLTGINIIGLTGTGANNLWFTGYGNGNGYPTAYLYKWNGSSLSQHELPVTQGKVFRAQKFFRASDNGIYLAGMEFDPNNYGDSVTHTSMLLHWDGYSWAKVPGSESLMQFVNVHGSSSCDLMAVGGKHTANGFMGATFHRNGNQWVTQTHTNLDFVHSVVKISPYKFVLQGHEDTGGASGQMWMGAYNGTEVGWSKNFSYYSEGSKFYSGGPTWKIPGTNIIMTAGDGGHGASDPSGAGTYAFVFRSTCQ